MVVLSSFAPPQEGVVHKQESTQAHIQGQGCIGKGTLFIAESRVSWFNAETGDGFSLEYPSISLHAVSRDLNAFPQQCLYLMIDADLRQGNQDSSDESEGECIPMTEVRFIPEDIAALDALFTAMSSCQTLHPDEDDSISEEELGVGGEGDGDYYDTAEGAEYLSQDGQETLQRLEQVFASSEAERRDAPLPQAGGLQDGRGDGMEDGQEVDMADQDDQFEDADMER